MQRIVDWHVHQPQRVAASTTRPVDRLCLLVAIVSLALALVGTPTPGVAQGRDPVPLQAGSVTAAAAVTYAGAVTAAEDAQHHADSVAFRADQHQPPGTIEIGPPGSGIHMVTEWVELLPSGSRPGDSEGGSAEPPKRLRITVVFTAN